MDLYQVPRNPLSDQSDWDLKRALKASERTVPWLARKTGVHPMTVYRYVWGHRTPPIGWLAQARAALEGQTQ